MNTKFNFPIVKTILFYISLFLLVYGLSNIYNDMDYDFWARLIAGKHVAQTGSVMYNDVLSYTPTHTWYDPEWLSSTLLYLITEKFGVISITVTKIILNFVSIFFVTLAAATVKKQKLYSLHFEYFILIFTILFIGGSSGIFLRCQLFSYIFLSLWIILLEKASQYYDNKNYNKYFILMPLVMLLWLNFHGACIAGVGIMILYILGRILNKLPIKKYMVTLIPVSLVFFINPWGYEYIKFLIDSSFLDRSWIIEWQPLFTSYLTGGKQIITIMAIILIIYILGILVNKFKNFNFTKLLFVIVTLYLSISHYKHVPLFAIISGIYIYDDYVTVFKKVTSLIFNKFKITNIMQQYLGYLKDIIVIVLVFGYALFYTITAEPIKESVGLMKFLTFPTGVVEFINKNNIKGKMFLPYFYGSYVAYKTYPNIKIFMDGRQEQVYDYDLFDNEMFFLYGTLGDKKPIVEKYPPDMYMLAKDWQVYNQYVENLPNYTFVYGDELFALYIRNDLLKSEYKQVQPTYQFDIDTILENNIDFRKK